MIDPDLGYEVLDNYGETGEHLPDAVDIAATLAKTVCANEAELAAFVDAVQAEATEVMAPDAA